MRLRRCVSCGLEFFPEVSHKIYCSPRCKKRVNNQRACARQGAYYSPKATERSHAFTELENPTAEMLSYLAQGYLSGLNDKPSVFRGRLPKWECPAGVRYIVSEYDGSGFMEREPSAAASAFEASQPINTEKNFSARAILDKVYGQAQERAANVLPQASVKPASSVVGTWKMKETVDNYEYDKTEQAPRNTP